MDEFLLARIERFCSAVRYAEPLSADAWLLVEHDLFRKPVSTFRDHALMPRQLDRLLEQMRIVGVVGQRDAMPGVVLHIEHQRLDLASGRLGGDARPARAAQFGL